MENIIQDYIKNDESNEIITEKKILNEKEKMKEIINKLFIYNSYNISDSNKNIPSKIFPESINYKFSSVSSNFLSYLYTQNYYNIPILSEKGIFHIYGKIYENFDKKKNEKFISKISKILFFSYKRNFYPINERNNRTFTSDSGWGCMLRSSQMIFSRALYLYYYKKLKYDKIVSLLLVLNLFYDNPFNFEKMPDNFTYFMNYFLKMKFEEDKQKFVYIHKIFPPFSIQSICYFSEIYKKKAGDWFSDINMVNIFKLISENYNVFNNEIKIITCLSSLNLMDVLKEGFEKVENIKNEEEKKDYFFHENVYYKFSKVLIIFISVRIGLNVINEMYYSGIRKLFTCKQNIGIIGGESFKAHYFIGYNKDGNLLFLDPHITKESFNNNEINDYNNLINDYLVKNIHQLKISQMTTAFTIGFFIKNYKEFIEFLDWAKKYRKDDNCVFGIIETEQKFIEYEDNEQDDF
jgi:cysteine protease ATG4